jgi:phage-related protein
MRIHFHELADREYQKLDRAVQNKFRNIFNAVEKGDPIPLNAKKSFRGTEMFEYRVKVNTNIYRAIGSAFAPDQIILLFFQKKSQKTPLRILETAIKRFKSLPD